MLRDVVELGDLPFQVKFELLETIFLDTIDNRTAATIQRLDGLGIHMEMDDFGSGHASIIALLNLRPSTVKIDGRLVARIAEDDYRHRIVRSIVDLVTSLDINVTAEGVETEEQARILTEIGCHKLQGHYFSYPLSEKALLQAFGSELSRRQSGDGSAS